MKQKFTKGSGNVFADLGLPDPDERAYKAELVIALKSIIKRRAMTQVEAAQVCGTDQGTLSKVLRGRTSLVTTDRLLRWIGGLGESMVIVSENDFDSILKAIDNPCPQNESLVRAMENHRSGKSLTVCLEKTVMASVFVFCNMREYKTKEPFVLYSPFCSGDLMYCYEASIFYRNVYVANQTNMEVKAMNNCDSLSPVFKHKESGSRCCVLGHAKSPNTEKIFVIFKDTCNENDVYCLESSEFFSVMEPSWSGL